MPSLGILPSRRSSKTFDRVTSVPHFAANMTHKGPVSGMRFSLSLHKDQHQMEQQRPGSIAAEMRRRFHQLQQLNLELRRQLEAAELLVPELNAMLNQLNTIQLANKLIWSA